MLSESSTPEALVQTALTAVRRGGSDLLRALDALPAPIYVTNADGVISHYNRACIPFAGRTPRVGHDSWCVTWKLYTLAGEALTHEQCPMAVAIRERRMVRGTGAVAERPDGTRVQFMPYPTPMIDADGTVTGAVNLLLEITNAQQARALRDQAERCRRLADATSDALAMTVLTAMALEYEDTALRLEKQPPA